MEGRPGRLMLCARPSFRPMSGPWRRPARSHSPCRTPEREPGIIESQGRVLPQPEIKEPPEPGAVNQPYHDVVAVNIVDGARSVVHLVATVCKWIR